MTRDRTDSKATVTEPTAVTTSTTRPSASCRDRNSGGVSDGHRAQGPGRGLRGTGRNRIRPAQGWTETRVSGEVGRAHPGATRNDQRASRTPWHESPTARPVSEPRADAVCHRGRGTGPRVSFVKRFYSCRDRCRTRSRPKVLMQRAGVRGPSRVGSLRTSFSPANGPLVAVSRSIYLSQVTHGSLNVSPHDRGSRSTDRASQARASDRAFPGRLHLPVSRGPAAKLRHLKPPWRALRFEFPPPKGLFLLCFSSAVLKTHSAGKTFRSLKRRDRGPAGASGRRTVLQGGSRLRPVCPVWLPTPPF